MELTEEEREIDTKKAFDLKGHSGHRNTFMAIERREMKGCWDLDSIRERFINFRKPF
jgi:hypothetical protein